MNVPSPLAQQRRLRSEKILGRLNVTLPEALDTLPDEAEVSPREPEEVLQRLLCLVVVGLKAEGLEVSILAGLIDSMGLHDHFNSEESAFLAQDKPEAEDCAEFAWRFESAWILWWALGFVPRLDSPVAQVEMTAVVGLIQNRSREELLSASAMRADSELLDEWDLMYRLQAAALEARRLKRPAPARANTSVVLERQLALQWLLDPARPGWDETEPAASLQSA